jgi:hypothetical protein
MLSYFYNLKDFYFYNKTNCMMKYLVSVVRSVDK